MLSRICPRLPFSCVFDATKAIFRCHVISLSRGGYDYGPRSVAGSDRARSRRDRREPRAGRSSGRGRDAGRRTSNGMDRSWQLAYAGARRCDLARSATTSAFAIHRELARPPLAPEGTFVRHRSNERAAGRCYWCDEKLCRELLGRRRSRPRLFRRDDGGSATIEVRRGDETSRRDN